MGSPLPVNFPRPRRVYAYGARIPTIVVQEDEDVSFQPVVPARGSSLPCSDVYFASPLPRSSSSSSLRSLSRKPAPLYIHSSDSSRSPSPSTLSSSLDEQWYDATSLRSRRSESSLQSQSEMGSEDGSGSDTSLSTVVTSVASECGEFGPSVPDDKMESSSSAETFDDATVDTKGPRVFSCHPKSPPSANLPPFTFIFPSYTPRTFRSMACLRYTSQPYPIPARVNKVPRIPVPTINSDEADEEEEEEELPFMPFRPLESPVCTRQYVLEVDNVVQSAEIMQESGVHKELTRADALDTLKIRATGRKGVVGYDRSKAKSWYVGDAELQQCLGKSRSRLSWWGGK